MGRRAFATLVTTDSYLPGALVLAASLRRHHPNPAEYDLLVLCTVATVSPPTLKALRLAFDVVVGVEPIALESVLADRLASVLPLVPGAREAQAALNARLALMGRLDLGSQGGCALTKLHLWRLTAYERIVYLDADMLVVGDLRDLLRPAPQPLDTRFHPGGRTLASSFHRSASTLLPPPLLAARDIGWPDTFNTGLLSLQPSWQVYEWIRTFLADLGSWDGADQGLLNDFFGAPLDPSPSPPSGDALTPAVPISSASSSADEGSLLLSTRRHTASFGSAPQTRSRSRGSTSQGSERASSSPVISLRTGLGDPLSPLTDMNTDRSHHPLGGRQFWGTWDPTAPDLPKALEHWHGPGWTPISFKYNVTVQGGYTHAPALRRFGPDVRAVHFIGHGNKPWDRPLPPAASHSSGPSRALDEDGVWMPSTDYMGQWHDLFREEYGEPWQLWQTGASSSEPASSSSYFEVIHTDRGIEVVERPARTFGVGDSTSYTQVIWDLVDKLERERTAAQYAPGGLGPTPPSPNVLPAHWGRMPISLVDPLGVDVLSRTVPPISSTPTTTGHYNPLANPLAPVPTGRGMGTYVSLPLWNRVGLLPPSLAHLSSITTESLGSESASEGSTDMFTKHLHAALHGAPHNDPAFIHARRGVLAPPFLPPESAPRGKRRRRRAVSITLPVATGESTADEDEAFIAPASEAPRRTPSRSRSLWSPGPASGPMPSQAGAEDVPGAKPTGLPRTLHFHNAWDADPAIDRFAADYQRKYMDSTEMDGSPMLRFKNKGALALRRPSTSPERDSSAERTPRASPQAQDRAGGAVLGPPPEDAERLAPQPAVSDVETDVESDAFSGSVFESDSDYEEVDAPPYPLSQSSVDRYEWLLRARRTRRRPSWRKQTPSGIYLRRAGAYQHPASGRAAGRSVRSATGGRISPSSSRTGSRSSGVPATLSSPGPTARDHSC